MDYVAERKRNQKRNEKFLSEFDSWLKEKNLTDKTIRKHLSNVDLFINDYLNYYGVIKMEYGIIEAVSFLNGWFIEKCMWASRTSLRETAASIKKFYQCMSEKGYVTTDNYKILCTLLKENMEDFYQSLYDFDNMICEDIW